MKSLRLSELMGALSHALDITEGQPEGHCVRCCLIGMNIAEQEQWELYYTLLLKDMGCSSNAARICALYLTDDLAFKRDFKWVEEYLCALSGILSHVDKIANELIQTCCTCGADIACQLRFPDSVAQGIHSLDEHWRGSPGARLKKQAGQAPVEITWTAYRPPPTRSY